MHVETAPLSPTSPTPPPHPPTQPQKSKVSLLLEAGDVGCCMANRLPVQHRVRPAERSVRDSEEGARASAPTLAQRSSNAARQNGRNHRIYSSRRLVLEWMRADFVIEGLILKRLKNSARWSREVSRLIQNDSYQMSPMSRRCFKRIRKGEKKKSTNTEN